MKAVAEAVEAGEGVLQLPLAFSGRKKKVLDFKKCWLLRQLRRLVKFFTVVRGLDTLRYKRDNKKEREREGEKEREQEFKGVRK